MPNKKNTKKKNMGWVCFNKTQVFASPAIKQFDYTIQLTFFLHKPTYSCYKLQIPKLRTIDTKLMKY